MTSDQGKPCCFHRHCGGFVNPDPDHIGDTCKPCAKKIAKSITDGYKHFIDSGLSPHQALERML